MSRLSRRSSVEAQDFLSGIWLFWDPEKVTVEILTKNKQIIKAVIKKNKKNGYCLLYMRFQMMLLEGKQGISQLQ